MAFSFGPGGAGETSFSFGGRTASVYDVLYEDNKGVGKIRFVLTALSRNPPPDTLISLRHWAARRVTGWGRSRNRPRASRHGVPCSLRAILRVTGGLHPISIQSTAEPP